MRFIFTFICEFSSSRYGGVGLIEVLAGLTKVISCLTWSGVIMSVTGKLIFIRPGELSADQTGSTTWFDSKMVSHRLCGTASTLAARHSLMMPS